MFPYLFIPKSWPIDFNLKSPHRVNQTSGTLSPFPRVQRTCLKRLSGICGHYNLPPRSMQIEVFKDPADDALYRGGFGEVYKCRYQNLDVAVKALKTYSEGDMQRVTRVS